MFTAKSFALAAATLALLTSVTVAQSFTVTDNQLSVPRPVVYEGASDKIKPESDVALRHVAAFMAEKSYVSTLRIEVHTDSDGMPAINQELSQKRARAVAARLVKLGVDCKRLLPVGFGATKPVAENKTAEGKAQNRRTVFVLAALRGRPIGGMPLDGGGRSAGDPCR